MASLLTDMPSEVYSLLSNWLAEFGLLGALICVLPWFLGLLWDMVRGFFNML